MEKYPLMVFFAVISVFIGFVGGFLPVFGSYGLLPTIISCVGIAMFEVTMVGIVLHERDH